MAINLNHKKNLGLIIGILLITINFLPMATITTGGPLDILGWAVYANSGNVYRCAIGGSPEMLYSGSVSHACWSADGSYIYFIKSNGDIWVMNNDGTSPTELRTDTSNTGKCPIGPYRPNTNYVLYVEGPSFYTISRLDGTKTLIHTDTNGYNWDGEIAISTDGTRIAARDGDGLYKMTVGDGSSSVYYSVRCSSSISPNGQYLTKNWNGHTEMSIYTWDVYYPNTPHQHLHTPPGITWDNQKFSANSDDYVVYKIDSGATAIGLVRLSDESHWQIGNRNSDFPDFLLGPLPDLGDSPPTITSTAIPIAHVGHTYTYDVQAAGNPPATFALTTAPKDMNINPTNGIITWLPDTDDIATSPHAVTITATNTEGSDTQNYQITVTESSAACSPGFNMVEDVTATGNSGTILTITVCGETYTVADNDLISGTTTRYASGGGSVNPSPYFSEYADNFSLDDMTTLDSGSGAAYLDTMFTEAASTFIIFENGGSSTGGHDSGDIQGLDISGNPVGSLSSFTDSDYYESGYQTGMGRMAGALSFTTTLPVYGIRISNAEGMDPVSISAVVGSTAGLAPIITTLPVIEVNVGEPYVYDVDATGDPTITYALVHWPTEMTIDTTTGIIQWMPDTPADFDVTVSASNSYGADTQSFQITVSTSSTTPCSPGLNMVEGVSATGDAGMILTVTVCGATYVVADGDLVTGTTTRYDTGGSPVNPGIHFSENADNFDLDIMTTLDSGTGAAYLDTMFTEAASTFIIFENGANAAGTHDSGDIQGLDISGNPVGSLSSFTDGDYFESGYQTGMNRMAGVLSFTAESPVYGIRLSNAVGMDPVSISAVYGSSSGLSPIITSIPETTANAGELYQYDVDAFGDPVLAFSLTTSPTGMTIDSGTGMISWLPDSGDVATSPHDIIISVANSYGSDTQNFSLTVSGSTPTPCSPGMNMVENVSATGNSGSILSVTVCGATYVVAEGDLVTGTTTRYDSGGNPVNPGQYYSEYTDNFGLNNMTTLDTGTASYLDTMFTTPASKFIIFENGANAAGTHDSGDIQGLDISGNPVGSLSSFTDSDYFESGYQTGMGRMAGVISFTTTSSVYGIRISNAVGMDPVSISAVTGTSSGEAPIITSTPLTIINEGELYQYDVVATGSPTPTYSLTIAPTGMTIDSSTGMISWLPDSGDVATSPHDVTVEASNSQGTDSQSYLLAVTGSTPTPCSPGLNMIEDVTATGDAGTILTVTVCGETYTVADSDLQTGTTTRYDSSGGPINPGQYYSEYADNFSLYDMTTLDDGTGVSYLDTMFNSPANTFIIFENGAITNGSHDSGDIQGLNEIGNPIGSIYSFTNNNYYQTSYETGMGRLAGALAFTAESPVYGVRISNAVGMDPVSISAVTASSTPTPPTIISTEITTAIVGQQYTYDVQATGNPAPGYTLTTAPTGMIIHPSTGLITWIPDQNDLSANPHDVTIQATNTEGSDSQSYQINAYNQTYYVIMPLGDSITRGGGSTNDNGYRKPLYTELTNNGYNFEFVGSLSDGDFPNPEHEGWGGKTASWLNTRLNGPTETFLQDNPPDIILYHIGTNNLGGTDIEQYAADANESLQIIYDYDPSIHVILAKIILTRDDATRNIRTHNYNLLLENISSYWQGQGYPITLVDMETGAGLNYDTSDMVDNLHPNDAGYAKMAPVWFNALTPLLSSGVTVEDVVLTASSPANSTDDELTVTYTPGLGTTTVGVSWFKNSSALMNLYMPIEGNSVTALNNYADPSSPIAMTPMGTPEWYPTGHDGTGAFELVYAEDDYIDITGSMPTGSYTKTAWIYLTSDSNSATRNNIISGDGHALWVPVDRDGLVRTVSGGHNTDPNNWRTVVDTEPLALHTWYFIAISYDQTDGTMRLYRNGSIVDTATSIPMYTGSGTTFIGAYPSGGGSCCYSDMMISEARIYDHVVSADQLQTLYTQISTITSNETSIGDQWQASVIPFNTTTAGESILSNIITILPNGPYAPTITSVPSTQAIAESLYSYDVESIGNPTPTYSLTVAPATMTIDANTGIITWIPTTGDIASNPHDVTITATNAEGTDSQSYQITITESPSCPDSLIHYWKLDETSGLPYEDSIGAADLSCSHCPSSTPGKVNNAQQFTAASTQNLYSSPISNPTDAITLMAWVKPDSITSPDKGIITKADTFLLEIESDGAELSFSHYKGGTLNECELAIPVFTVGTWVHVAATWDGSIARIYVNGSEIGSEDFDDGPIDNNINPIYIGNSTYHANRFFDGIIDEVAIFDTALTEAEISTLYQQGVNGQSLCQQGTSPQIISTPITTATVDQPYSYDAQATGNPTPNFLLETSPTGMTINTSSGLIEWTPTAGQTGSHQVTINATNTHGWDLQTFTIDVSDTTVPGDANGDGNVNAIDITYIELIIMGQRDPTPGADANEDGNINAIDITKTELIILGA